MSWSDGVLKILRLKEKTTSLICQHRTWELCAFCRERHQCNLGSRRAEIIWGVQYPACVLWGTHLPPWAKGETGNLNPAFIPANVISRSFLHGLSHFRALSDSLKESEGRPKAVKVARLGYSCDCKADNGWVGEGSAAAHADKPSDGKALPSQGLLQWKAKCLGGSQLCQSPPAPRELIHWVPLGDSCTAPFSLPGLEGWAEHTVI